ncbi:MAG: chorismate mutase [candidate division KSB1 bacterium]|nr:chorismate mutase [candidate division KSB1 bacterium]
MSLEELRQQIDEIDTTLVDLLNQRAQISLKIRQQKRALNRPIYDPQREQSVLQRVAAANRGPLPNQQLQDIFLLIIQSCRNLQQTQKG